MFNLEQVLAPINGDDPCGADMAFSTDVDAINKARQADDPSLEQGAWVTPLKEADWKFVGTRCAALIATRSKDLQLAVWLAEARARTDGLRGLADGLTVVAQLCARFWDGLYPRPDEGGFEQRIGNLCWIAARAPQLIREVPLTEGDGMSLADIEAVRGGDGSALEAARRATTGAFYKALLDDIAACTGAVVELESVVDRQLGADGPSFSAIRAALESVQYAVAPHAREAGVETAQEAPQGDQAPVQASIATAPQSSPGGPLQSRAQALKQLRQIADYFRSTEPHSPVAYLADKAADWGDQPLHTWLRGVVKDPAALAAMEELLGSAAQTA